MLEIYTFRSSIHCASADRFDSNTRPTQQLTVPLANIRRPHTLSLREMAVPSQLVGATGRPRALHMRDKRGIGKLVGADLRGRSRRGSAPTEGPGLGTQVQPARRRRHAGLPTGPLISQLDRVRLCECTAGNGQWCGATPAADPPSRAAVLDVFPKPLRRRAGHGQHPRQGRKAKTSPPCPAPGPLPSMPRSSLRNYLKTGRG